MKPIRKPRRLLAAALGAATITLGGGCFSVGNLLPPPEDVQDTAGTDDADTADTGPEDAPSSDQDGGAE